MSPSLYPNWSELKKNRTIRIQEAKGKCESCGKDAQVIHHKDENKSNHNLDNLAVLCRACHFLVHSNQPKKNTLFIRLYGISLPEMVNKFGYNVSHFYTLHKRRELLDFLLLEEYKEKSCKQE